MSVLFLIFFLLVFQESPTTKLVYQLTASFSNGDATDLTIYQFYDKEGYLILGGYSHKLNQPSNIDRSLDLPTVAENEKLQQALDEALSQFDAPVNLTGGTRVIDTRTAFMREFQQAPEFFRVTRDSIFDVRPGFSSGEVLGFPISNLQWLLYDETHTIDGYTVQKARIDYFGRKFTAWFTTEIPLVAGPHIFTGLPGTIIELVDEAGVYRFTLSRIERESPPGHVVFPETHTILTHEEAVGKQWVAVQRYIQDLRGQDDRFFQQMGGLNHRGSSTATQPVNFNPYEHFLEWDILETMGIARP